MLIVINDKAHIANPYPVHDFMHEMKGNNLMGLSRFGPR